MLIPPGQSKYEQLNPNYLLSRIVRKAGSHPNLRSKTYCKLQSQFKLLVLEKLLDLGCHGDRNESPNKMIAGHIDNVCSGGRIKNVSKRVQAL